MTIKKFLQEYNAMYETIYNYNAERGEYPGEKLVTWAFDEWLTHENNKDLLREIVKERQDMFVSDRECAAFMLTLDKLSLI